MGGALSSAPLVYPIRRQLALLAPIRLVLGIVALGAALAVGSRDGAIAGGFALGALGAAFTLAADRRFAASGLAEPPPLPGDARVLPPLRAAFSELFPSTAGVWVLAGISLAFEPILAGLLAGVLFGMGVASVSSLLTLHGLERRAGGRLFVERGRGRLFAGPEKIAG